MCEVAPVSGPITLVEDVWTGANVTITANVTVAKGCIIGAGAVLTKSTEPYGIYVGVPARRVKDR
jgi:acetyltransferase-like isoleucine patch superfamily enzyme